MRACGACCYNQIHSSLNHLRCVAAPKMVGGYSLRVVTLVLSTFISLHATVVSAARFGTVCDRTVYGFPDYAACNALLVGRDGIFYIDDREHGFLLPYFGFKSQFTDNQWRNRIDLPQVWRNGRYLPYSTLFRGMIISGRTITVDSGIEGCNVALFVNINPNGGFLTDSGSWGGIARRGKDVVRGCLLYRRNGGGAAYAGMEILHSIT